MKKHFLIAAIMVPFLTFVGYALTDWYLKKDQPPAALVQLKRTEPNCQLTHGCTLAQQDFLLTLTYRNHVLHIQTNQRLKGIMLEVVGLQPPQKAQAEDKEGYRWRLPLKEPPDHALTLRLVAQSHWRNYIGELTVQP